MKKLVLSMALLAGLTFVSCNKDDDGGNCLTCEIEGESEQVCPNGDGFVEGTEMTPEEFVDAYCDNGNPDENTNCVTCASYTIQGQTMPAQEVCEDADGNAVVNGQSMPVTYDQYIQTAEMMTTCD